MFDDPAIQKPPRPLTTKGVRINKSKTNRARITQKPMRPVQNSMNLQTNEYKDDLSPFELAASDNRLYRNHDLQVIQEKVEQREKFK